MRLGMLVLSQLLFLYGSTATAEGDTHGAHVHGEAELTLVLEGADLLVEFKSPAMNLVGFEHQPKSEGQRSRIKTTIAQLEAVSDWFALNGGMCVLKTAHVETSFESANKHHHKHDHGHEKHEDKDSSHNDFSAEYHYACKNPESFSGMEFKLSAFQAVEEVQVQWIVGGKQGAIELSGSKASLRF